MNCPPAFDQTSRFSCSRRRFFRQLSFGTALFTVPGLFAEELVRKTPWVEEGPFYPPRLPLDTDNDLLIVNDSLTPAVGEITHISGRLLDIRGEPIRNATIELWEADSSGVYLADRPRTGDHSHRSRRLNGPPSFMAIANGSFGLAVLRHL